MSAYVSLTIFLISLSTSFAGRNQPCTTPNGEAATCVSLKSCAVIYNAVSTGSNDALKFAKKSTCDYDKPKKETFVCCGSTAFDREFQIDPSELLANLAETDEIQAQVNALSDKTLCGIHSEPKIKGGKAANIDEFPWIAALEYKYLSGGGSAGIRCGGSIITDRYIMTAAHCIKNIEFKPFMAWLGVSNVSTGGSPNCISTNDDMVCGDPAKKFKIEKAITHERYVIIQYYNDIGLLRLAEKITFNEYIRPICLPTPDAPVPENRTRLVVAGWGNVDNNGNQSDVKLKLEVPVVPNSDCNRLLVRYNKSITSNQICAGGEIGKDSCQGDSGGPLMKEHQDTDNQNHWYAEGIVSYGIGCGIEDVPTVYTRVGSYVQWIVDKISRPGTGRNEICTTPNGEKALCRSLPECVIIIKELSTFSSEAIGFTRKSLCDFDVESYEIFVCCGSSAASNNYTFDISTYLTERVPNLLGTNRLEIDRPSDKLVCGLQTDQKSIGGIIAQTETYPWMAAIAFNFSRYEFVGDNYCSGSVISDRYVLSTAACLLVPQTSSIKVWLGIPNLSSNSSNCFAIKKSKICGDALQKFDVAKFIPHERYNSTTDYHNVGLILLAKKITFNDYIRPICLPTSDLPPLDNGTRMTLAGLSYDGYHSVDKFEAVVLVVPNSDCQKILKRNGKTIATHQLCTADATNVFDCDRPSGTVIRNHTDKTNQVQWFIEGVTSSNTKCRDREENTHTIISTRVAAYVEWIVNEINAPATAGSYMRNSSCTTPNGENARCLPTRRCDTISNATETEGTSAIEFAEQSVCGFDTEPLVCCGTLGDFNSTITTLIKNVWDLIMASSSKHEKDTLTVPEDYLRMLPNNSVCGLVKNEDMVSRSKLTTLDEFPWAAALEYKYLSNAAYAGIHCSGSVITTRHVITAYYCCYPPELRLTYVLLGKRNITVEPGCIHARLSSHECVESEHRFRVKSRIPHPLLRSEDNGIYDIALVVLEREITYSDYIRPICIPPKNFKISNVNTSLAFTGWGIKENGTQKPSDIKLNVDVTLLENDVCRKELKRNVTENQLCADGGEGKDACEAASGGPLMRLYKDPASGASNWYLEAVVNYRYQCVSLASPTIYTQISKVLLWIENVMVKN